MVAWTEIVKKENDGDIITIRKKWRPDNIADAYEYAIIASEDSGVECVNLYHGIGMTPWEMPTSTFRRGKLIRG